MDITGKRGMTLIEVIVASFILSILIMVAMSAIVDMLRVINNKNSITRMDQKANAILRDVAQELKSAILPVPVNEDTTLPFEQIDDTRRGFKAGSSQGDAWARALLAGTDSIAFIVPVDAQQVGDFLDDNGHLQTGYVRSVDGLGTVPFLGASATGTPREGNNFHVQNTGEWVNALAVVDPARFTAGPFAEAEYPTDWNQIYAGAIPNVTCFMALRFVPVHDTAGQPIVIRERDLLNNRNTAIYADLDDDGTTNGEFEIGYLQLVYSGGKAFYINVPTAGGASIRQADLQPGYKALSDAIVLRRVDSAGPATPIFQLVRYDTSNIETSGENAGLPNLANQSTGGGATINIKLLVLDNEGVDRESGSVIPNIHTLALQARWYETAIRLNNMER